MITDQLITNAYYLSNIVSRDEETVAGSQLADGLRMLNDILAEKSMSGRHIPYYGHASLDTVKGQEEYDVSGLIVTDAVTFNIGEVRYSMRRRHRKFYFGSPRVDNIESLPYSYHAERIKGGTRLYLYFLPVDVFEVNITGKFALTQLAADDELSDTLDNYYVSYLTYKLAKRLCDFYDITFSQQKMQTLMEIEDQLNDVSPQDLSIKKMSTLTNKVTGYNWADVNIGRGWRP
jgi:hypothetical protein